MKCEILTNLKVCHISNATFKMGVDHGLKITVLVTRLLIEKQFLINNYSRIFFFSSKNKIFLFRQSFLESRGSSWFQIFCQEVTIISRIIFLVSRKKNRVGA